MSEIEIGAMLETAVGDPVVMVMVIVEVQLLHVMVWLVSVVHVLLTGHTSSVAWEG